MEDQAKTLLQDIRRFLKARGMAETTFGLQAVNDGKFVRRLSDGGNITVRTINRVRGFMAGYDKSAAKPAKPRAA